MATGPRAPEGGDAGRLGKARIKGGEQPLGAFRVPKRLAGKTLIVVSYGSLTGTYGHIKAQWGWEWQLRIRKG